MIYGLRKVHKTGVPLRPIVTCIGFPSYKLSQYIASLITLLTGQTESHVKYSKHFVEMMKDVCLAEDQMLVSFDVVFLCTNVPIKEAVDTIRERLQKDVSLEMRTPLSPERIAELLELCLMSTYFSYNSEFYEHTRGVAMGFLVSAVVANLYMEFFEELALRLAPVRPRLWKQYVDNTCCIAKRNTVEGLLNHLNSI